MNPSRLLQHFDRLSEAPDAVPRLRQFILDLAVRGKLVEQDPTDEPAAELLEQISTIVGQRAAISGRQVDRLPFALPFGWEWSRVELITTKTGSGSTPRGGQSVYQAIGVPFLRSQNVYNDGLRLNGVAYIEHETHTRMQGTAVEPGDLLLNITGGSIGRCCRIPDRSIEANISQHVAIIRLAVAPMRDFMHKVVLSPFFQSFVVDEQTGAGRGGLPKNRMDQIPVPIPPLGEQHRIVAKVDELMGLCDRLEAAQSKQEQRRDRLVAASLQQLQDSEGLTQRRKGAKKEERADRERLGALAPLRESVFLQDLPRLTTRPEHIKALRQTILNLAVIGLLTTRQTGERDACEDLKKIEAKKRALALRKEKPIRAVSIDEHWCELPIGWTWARWDHITDWITYGFTRPMPHVNEGVPIVTGKNVNFGRILLEAADKTTQEAYAELSEKDRPKIDDILITKDGSIGRSAVVSVDDPFCINQSVAVLWLRSCHLNRRFLQLVIDSPQTQGVLLAKTEGVAIKHISVVDFGKMVLPLPPLAEQHRIVAKVDELMALCDQLEAQLTTTQTESRRLLEAVLHEALA